VNRAAGAPTEGTVSELPLPAGFGVELDPGTRQLTESILFGGSPARALRLSAAGRGALAELRAGPVRSAAAGLLARRLTDAGLAHPRPPAGHAGPGEARAPARPGEARAPARPGGPPPPAPAADVTVLIPVRDRPGLLDQCLAAVGTRYPVRVVDDGSADPAAIRQITARRGAVVLRRAENGGPAAARNTGLAGIGSDLIAFLDSDCVPPPDWIERLAAHLADPLVAAVAPRIVAPAGNAGSARSAQSAGAQPRAQQRAPSWAHRYAAACGSLDLGQQEARVVPATRVAYVPTAALLVRRAALEAAARGPQVFDTTLRYGEDVDLVWRLHDAGWRIRYDPGVTVPHHGPDTWSGLLGKRFSYGTSAAPLARRHPGRLAPLVLQPWPALAVAALAARRPAAAAAAVTAGWLMLTQTVRRAGLPADGAARASLTAVRQTWLGTGRYATQFAAPVLAAALALPGGRPRARWGRRAVAAALLVGPPVDTWRQRRPALDPVRFAIGHIADDIAYGAGVWTGCLRERTLAPVTPLVSWRPLRVSRPDQLAPPQQQGRERRPWAAPGSSR
jgi:mycofactocin glycosyltransferase